MSSRAERRSTGRSDEDDEAAQALRQSQRSPPPKQRRPRSAGKAPGSSSGRRRKASPSPSGAGAGGWLAALVPTPSALSALAKEFRAAPAATGRRVGKKLLLASWTVIVLLAVLSLLGVDVNPFSGDAVAAARGSGNGGGGGLLAGLAPASLLAGSRRSVAEADPDADEDAVDEDGNPLPPAAAAGSGAGAGGSGDGGEDVIPEMTGYEVKKPAKINKVREKQLACEELDCAAQCMRKMTPKCAAKKSCKADREKICRRRCLKARCEERCKDEPHYGYVEREQKMDKCKEGCQGNTAAHNKCIKKCHSEYKPCKSRCHEISARFKCDAPPAGAAALFGSDAGAGHGAADEEDEEEPAEELGGAGDDDGDEDAGAGAARAHVSVGSGGGASSLRGGGGGIVDDLDDEVI